MDEAEDKQGVTWVPAHPCYGGLSMFRYWKSLEQAQRPGDRYQCQSVLGEAGERPVVKQGKLRRIFTRRLSYPRTVSAQCHGELAHIFDHSWADMLSCVPKRMAKVITVHDLIPFRFAGSLTTAQQDRFRACVEQLRFADLIVSVSEYTKREIVDLLGIDEQRICVVPNGVDVMNAGGVDMTWIDALLKQADGSIKIGSLGSTLERKNLGIFPAALQAFTDATGETPTLIRAGQLLPNPLRQSIVNVSGEDHLVELGFVSDPQLEAFFAAIDVMVVPSFYEGFGLPVIEAMARGVPVIAADTSSLPEVGRDAALYFDPNDPEALAAALVEVAKPETAQKLQITGRRRAEAFTWRQSLEGCHSVYDAAIKMR